jgi:hypothetical protein
MTELQIPEKFKPGFKLLISIDEKTIQSFIDTFQQAQPLQINDLVSVVTSRVNTLTKKEVKDVIETLISIHNLRDYLQENNDASTNEVIEKISQAVEDDEELEITDEQRQEFERRLVNFLGLDNILSFRSRSIEVIRDHERLFQNSRIRIHKVFTKYEVFDLVGKNCITVNDGQKIYDLVHPQLQANQPVELDFAGVEIFAAPFFNFAIGQLLKDIQPENISKLLKISNIKPLGNQIISLVIENSKRYYSDPIFRSRLDKAVNEKSNHL